MKEERVGQRKWFLGSLLLLKRRKSNSTREKLGYKIKTGKNLKRLHSQARKKTCSFLKPRSEPRGFEVASSVHWLHSHFRDWAGKEGLAGTKRQTTVFAAFRLRCQSPPLLVMPDPQEISSRFCNCAAGKSAGRKQRSWDVGPPRVGNRTCPIISRFLWSSLETLEMNREINSIQNPNIHLLRNLVWKKEEDTRFNRKRMKQV